MDLAEKIIENKAKRKELESALDEYGVDKTLPWIQYLAERARAANPHLYNKFGTLMNGGTPVPRGETDMAVLVRTDKINNKQAAVVHQLLLDTVPRLSRDKVLISESLAWDRVTGRLESGSFSPTDPWV